MAALRPWRLSAEGGGRLVCARVCVGMRLVVERGFAAAAGQAMLAYLSKHRRTPPQTPQGSLHCIALRLFQASSSLQKLLAETFTNPSTTDTQRIRCAQKNVAWKHLITQQKAAGSMAAPAGPLTGVLASTAVPVWLHLCFAMGLALCLGQGRRGSLAVLAYAVAASVYMSWAQGQVRGLPESVLCSCGHHR